MFVVVGAGAALAGLVTTFPQLVWLSGHKVAVFGGAGALLVISGLSVRYASRLPCPTEPAAARGCARLRRVSIALLGLGVSFYAIGAFFAFALPRLTN